MPRAGDAAPAVPALLAESSVVGCLVLDESGGILASNAAIRKWLSGGAEESLSGRDLGDFLARSDDRNRLAGALRSRAVSVLSFAAGTGELARKLICELVPAAGSLPAGTSYALLREASGGEQSSARLERSARLEALGSLTSGVAHDFNNLLTILVGNLSLLGEELRSDPRKFGKLKAARDAARRGGELIKQLLSFARQEPVPSRLINPAKVISRIAPLIARALGKSIEFELDLDENADPIEGNSAQLESVIVNLSVNARDAIETSGKVIVSVSSERIGDESRASSQLAPGRYLRISVCDNGAGIPADLAAKVFEPFFTTKGDGKGSGLGLSMVKAYAEQFGGMPELVSEVGKGTTVSLWFPSHTGVAEESAAMTAPVASLPSGSESIAVLAVDESLSSMMDQILSVLGYRCQIVTSLEDAKKLLAASEPDLWVCDGFDIVGLLAAAGPGTKGRVLMLGFVTAPDSPGQCHLLHKPFSLPDLAGAVRRALDGETQPGS